MSTYTDYEEYAGLAVLTATLAQHTRYPLRLLLRATEMSVHRASGNTEEASSF